ncbi:MAG: ATP-dependent DNA ligase [Deltaproteobacteria bacterium]|nr:ATP-dependent DNA ligase [Deltaproteobacteria bacterium]
MQSRFVIHKHNATHLHYDFRLEAQGALKSWAVPKGLPDAPGARRLAVAVEDHPLDYISFEGVIPEGSYGAGTVEIWDKGTYTVESWEADKVVFRLKGEKLTGRYALILTGGKNWLILKLKEPGK